MYATCLIKNLHHGDITELLFFSEFCFPCETVHEILLLESCI
jgi:hypothetical protein